MGAAGGGEDVDVGGHAAVAFVTGPGHGYLWGNAKGEKGGDEGLAPGVGGDVLPFREVGDVSDRADEADGLHGGVDAGFAGDLFESFVVVGIVAQLRKDQVVGGVGGEGGEDGARVVVEVDFEEVACLVRDDAYEVRVDVTPSERGEVGEAQSGEAGEEECLAEEVLCRWELHGVDALQLFGREVDDWVFGDGEFF